MPVPVQGPSTLYDKIYESHIVREDGDTALLYIDRHIVHEVTSPQAFEGLRAVDRKVRRPDCTLVTSDHNVPTTNREHFKSAKTFIEEADSRQQVVTLEDNVTAFNLTYFGMNDKRQGIVHVIGPEQGFTLPGATLVCGDSHTSTHGAFGLLAFGIGTSEVEHVLATQTIIQKRAKDMRVCINGTLSEGVTSKDVILHIIGTIGTAGGTGSVIEFCGSTVEAMSMEARMSMCNMSIEAGARAGLIAPDETTFAYLCDRPLSPKGAEWDAAVKFWRTLKSDPEAKFDISVEIDGAQIEPTVSWGTSPQDVVPIGGLVPDPAKAKDANEKVAIERALEYMGLEPNTPMSEVKVDKVFIGSCTNSRIEDLRSAAKIVAGRHIASHVYAMIVPGSGLVKDQAEQEGLDTIFKNAGFDWREAGCSMCLGMNPDMLSPKERCASTSNRNFQNRQGPQGRTHLMSPAMATAAAITGHLTDVRKLSMGREKVAAPAPRSTSIEPSSIKADAKPEPTAERPDVVTDAPAQSAGGPKGGVAAPTVPAGLPKFEIYKGLAAPIDRANVDTDLIIQARHLKTIKRTGLGQYLFEALRFDRATGDPVPEFFMNQSKYDQAKILVVNGPNFGCGSSREHAGWSLLDHGIRCVIATSFGDIFSNNYMKNGCVAIQLDEATVAELYADAKACRELEIDLPKQVVRRDNGEAIPFKIDPFRKQCLIEGWDDVSLTLKHDADISAYEKRRKDVWPWLEGIGSGGRIPVRSAPLGSTEW